MTALTGQQQSSTLIQTVSKFEIFHKSMCSKDVPDDCKTPLIHHW